MSGSTAQYFEAHRRSERRSQLAGLFLVVFVGAILLQADVALDGSPGGDINADGRFTYRDVWRAGSRASPMHAPGKKAMREGPCLGRARCDRRHRVSSTHNTGRSTSPLTISGRTRRLTQHLTRYSDGCYKRVNVR